MDKRVKKLETELDERVKKVEAANQTIQKQELQAKQNELSKRVTQLEEGVESRGE